MLSKLFLFLSTAVSSSSVAASTYQVLVAGYGPWGAYSFNPSAATAEALNTTCQPMTLPEESQVCFTGWNITVDHSGASAVADALEAGDLAVDAVVVLGLEDGAKGLMLELAGVNVLADSAQQPIDPSQPVTALAPPTFDLARLDVETALEPILQHVAAARAGPDHKQTARQQQQKIQVDDEAPESLWSRDAGTYYCNEALYKTASTIRRLKVTHPCCPGLLLPFAFVHLPDPSLAPVDVVAPAIADLAAAMLVDVVEAEASL